MIFSARGVECWVCASERAQLTLGITGFLHDLLKCRKVLVVPEENTIMRTRVSLPLSGDFLQEPPKQYVQ